MMGVVKLNSKVVVGGPITAHTINRETEELGGFSCLA